MNDQERVRRIHQFRAEVAALEASGVVASDDPTIARVRAHHDTLLDAMRRDETLDLTREEARLSAGMRVATLFGAAALAIAWAMFVAEAWDHLGRTAKLALVWLPPFALVPAVAIAARRDRSGYVANIVAVVASIALAVACPATLNLYQQPDARWPFLLVGVFSLILAMRWRLLLPLVIAIGALGAWCWSLEGVPTNRPLSQSFDHGEPALVAGLLAIGVSGLAAAGPAAFRMAWRLAGTATVIVTLLVLGVAHESSGLGLGRASEGVYQVVGFLALVGMTWWGLRRDDPVFARLGAIGLILFLVFRLIDWFWQVIPDWLVFLLMGFLALAVLLVLRRLRLLRRAEGG